MIVVALLFAYPVYVLVNLSLKNPHEIGEAGIGLPSHLETSNYSNAWSGAHLGAAMIELDDHHGDQPGLPDHDRLDCRVLPRAHPVEAELRHVPAVPARHRAALPARAGAALRVHEGHRAARLLHVDGAVLHRACRSRSRSSSTPGSCARCRASTARPPSSTAPTTGRASPGSPSRCCVRSRAR